MSKALQVTNWLFGLMVGAWLLVAIVAVIYKVKGKKTERVPLYLILMFGAIGCSAPIANLRGRHVGLAVALTVVQVILVGVSAPMAWKRFVKHLRDEGLITKKPVE